MTAITPHHPHRPGFVCTAGVLLATASLTAVAPASVGSAQLAAHRVQPLTLARVDRRCFYRPSPSGAWPLYRTGATHAIRGGFNDPRGFNAAHFGVDVAARRDRAKVYAVVAGRVSNVRLTGPNARFVLTPAVGPAGTRFGYWHVVLTQVAPGTYVRQGQWIGRVAPEQNHVHLAERTAACGYVDPRRPTGILRDSANTEAPTISDLTAFVANSAAYTPYMPGADRSTPLALGDLHGKVDLRANVADMPRHATMRWPQQPLMVAGVRTWIAPRGDELLRLGRPIWALRGARVIPVESMTRVYAHGTYRVNTCFYRPDGHCRTRFILHVAGLGLDTTRFPNGNYQACVSAITINAVAHHRCWPITIAN
jgi:hypothetical protein